MAVKVALFTTLVEICSESTPLSILPLIGIHNRNRRENDDLLLNALQAATQPGKLVKKARLEGYVSEVVPRYTNFDFKRHFRLSRSTVQLLMEMLPPPVEQETGRPSLQSTSRETMVLLSLWTIGNQESFRGIADRFEVSDSQAHREFTYFCDAVGTLRAEMVRWPTGDAATRTMRKFSQLRGVNSFPDVIGCVDCAHVHVSAPKDKKESYFNRKQFTSVLLQGVCDSELRFTYIFAGWPGSAHDARVWRNSMLFDIITKQPTLIPVGAHLLGDSAYPLSSFLMVPYKDNGNLSRKEKNFSRTLSSTRVVIEHAFGHLFGRFRQLKYVFMFRSDRIPDVIMTGYVLHNLCISESDEAPEVLDPNLVLEDAVEVENDVPTRSAVQKRDVISDQLPAAL